MANKKITELDAGTPALTSVLPASDAAGTATNKVTVQSILNADTRWSLFLPPAPTSVTGVAGNAQVSLAWTAPSVAAQTPITDYTVQFSSNSGSTWTTFTDGTSTSASATVTGLTNGTAYVFRVAAINGVGNGAWSSASNSVTPVDGDPLFSSVALLLHADGNANDSSGTPKEVTLGGDYGSPATATGSPRFGSASFSFPEGAWARVTSGAFNRGTELPFTFEMFFKPAAFAGTLITISAYLSQWDNTSTSLGIQPDGTINFAQFRSGAGWTYAPVASVTVGQWGHIAVSRGSGSYESPAPARIYLNGQLMASASYSNLGNGWNVSPQVTIGGAALEIDEVRWTNAERYTGSTLIVPTVAFPNG